MSIPGKNEEALRRDSKVTPSNASTGGLMTSKKKPDITKRTSRFIPPPSVTSKHQSNHSLQPDRGTFLQIDELENRKSAAFKTNTNQTKASPMTTLGPNLPSEGVTSDPLNLASQYSRDAWDVRKTTIVPPVSLRLDESHRPNNPPTRRSTGLPSAPPSTASILTQPEDFKFALRQTKIESMKPDERKKQEKWAQSLIQRSGVCPEGYAWNRMSGGYQCVGGGHGMTDALIAEGKAGLLALRTKKWRVWDGPWYPNPRGKGFVKGTGYTDEDGLSK